jgi:mycothiol system anti-sigma-R factor
MKSENQGFGCSESMVRLHAYVDRELSKAEWAEVQRHLDDCPPCAKHFVFEEDVKRLVHNKACPERAPQELIVKILTSFKISR